MSRARRLVAVAVLAAVALVAAACGSSTGPPEPPPGAPPPPPWSPLPADGVARAVVTPSGFVLPVVADHGDGTYDVTTPCAATVRIEGEPLSGAHVVLDAGHGGEEPGAVGPNGLREADVNLAVALRAADALRATGATVVLTRDRDVRTTITTRTALANALAPVAFVSIHHNTVPDATSTTPGTDVYFQVGSEPSARLAGLLVDHVRAALAPFGTDWVTDVPSGAKARVNPAGEDFYGVLRHTAGVVPAALAENAFLSHPPEADLLAAEEVQQAEADAIARAVLGFVEGEVAPEEAMAPIPPIVGGGGGGGGGPAGCEDPPLH